MTTWEVILQGSARADLPAWAESPWCLRCLLLVMCTYRFAKKSAYAPFSVRRRSRALFWL